MLINKQKVITQKVNWHNNYSVDLYIKREDLIHNEVSGNKLRKLNFNLQQAKAVNASEIITFGGAFSNHVRATAAAGNIIGIKTVGIIRGDELAEKTRNSTLRFAERNEMLLFFVTRSAYQLKEKSKEIQDIISQFKNPFIVPEGGTNALAIKGCEDILNDKTEKFDYVCCPVGTGGTISGIINASHSSQQIIGFSALKGTFLKEDISRFAKKNNWSLNTDYHFGGYAKINEDLINFINEFKRIHDIPLEPIYTGKMLFGIYDLIKKGYFRPNSKILAIHTGGLQGIEGINQKLKQKKLPLIL